MDLNKESLGELCSQKIGDIKKGIHNVKQTVYDTLQRFGLAGETIAEALYFKDKHFLNATYILCTSDDGFDQLQGKFESISSVEEFSENFGIVTFGEIYYISSGEDYIGKYSNANEALHVDVTFTFNRESLLDIQKKIHTKRPLFNAIDILVSLTDNIQ